MNEALQKVVAYMKANWPSDVKDEWKVRLEEYPEILQRIVVDFTVDKTKECKMMRIAGISGSGKTTQLLPAAEKYFESKNLAPVLIAARRFVTYHPHYDEILKYYGEKHLREKTDEFSTIMMFLVLKELIEAGYDIILDVTLLDPTMEGILAKMLEAKKYEYTILLIAVSPEVAEKHLGGRSWRHTKETELEFIRATNKALEYYAENYPDVRAVIWNTYEKEPVYDAKIAGGLERFEQYSGEIEVPEHDINELCEAKIEYLSGK